MEPFLGQIMMVGFNFAPQGWALCDGQLLPISQNTALFALIGTFYGGDGRTTFALPDLRGRSAVGMGHGLGLLSNIAIGEKSGTEQISLSISNLPAHNHGLNVSNSSGTTSNPTGNYPAVSQYQLNRESPVIPVSSYGSAANSNMAGQAVGNTGGNSPFNNRNPYLGVNFIIALQGIFPSRP